MYIFKCKGTWIYSGQYNLYLSSTLIKNSIFCCVAPGHWDSRKIKFCAMFSKSSLFKIEYSINIETQCLKNIQLYSKPHFHIFTRKKGPLPMLPESSPLVQVLLMTDDIPPTSINPTNVVAGLPRGILVSLVMDPFS